jgi:hypothetical protein
MRKKIQTTKKICGQLIFGRFFVETIGNFRFGNMSVQPTENEKEHCKKFAIKQHVVSRTFSGKAFKSLLESLDGFDVRAETVGTLNTFLTSALKLENRYLTASQAYMLYSGFKMQPAMTWRVEHILCSRVFDAWLISRELMPVGWCYYLTERPTNPGFESHAQMTGPALGSGALRFSNS